MHRVNFNAKYSVFTCHMCSEAYRGYVDLSSFIPTRFFIGINEMVFFCNAAAITIYIYIYIYIIIWVSKVQVQSDENKGEEFVAQDSGGDGLSALKFSFQKSCILSVLEPFVLITKDLKWRWQSWCWANCIPLLICQKDLKFLIKFHWY